MNTTSESPSATADDLRYGGEISQARIDALIAAGRQERDRQLGLLAARMARSVGKALAVVARETYRVTLLPLSLMMQKEKLYAELNRLDDRLLRDIGMSRFDLPGTVERSVMDAAYGQPAAANQDGGRAAA